MTTETDTTEEEELDLEPEVRYTFTPEQLRPNTDHIEIEDGRLVDIFSEKQQRLLTEPLHTA
ncbi:MAG: hypothetical protein MUD01_26425 [Chloroflexaceae bacterium]|jgi:hypothetical protein|nr:hypothetical protein [Chloroflexaceae bacterium]